MKRPTLWLLLIPYLGLLWVPFYNFREPAVFGIPFFYWYQLAWVPVAAALTWLAYRSVRDDSGEEMLRDGNGVADWTPTERTTA